MPKTKSIAAARKKGTAASRDVQMAAIKEVAVAADLRDVRVVAFSGSLASPAEIHSQDDIEESISYVVEREPVSDPPVLFVKVDLTYSARAHDQPLGEISGEVMLVYLLNRPASDFSDAQLDQFAEVNGVYNAWPYLRELVQTSAARLRLPGAVLPPWRPPAKLPPKGKPLEMRRQG